MSCKLETVSRKLLEVASTIRKNVLKKAWVKEGIELIFFGFGYHVLTSVPLKLQKLTLPERTFTSHFRKIANAMAEVCAERKYPTRRLWLLVRCRNL